MSADFWASYASGVAGLLIGNPLDIVKVRLQAGKTSVPTSIPIYKFSNAGSLLRGTAAPVLGSGALNSILFVTYNQASKFFRDSSDAKTNYWTIWLAGAIGGLATWIVSTPTEVIKCRAQLSNNSSPVTSWGVAKHIVRTEGVRGLYAGGVVTALRDSIGYGFYFWSYELSSNFMVERMRERGWNSSGQETAKVLLCGGIAGVATWASVFPLDVIKTRVQMQVLPEEVSLVGSSTMVRPSPRRLGAVEIATNAYKTEGLGVFVRGLGVCSVRAFIVNAAQWAVYEWIMRELCPK